MNSIRKQIIAAFCLVLFVLAGLVVTVVIIELSLLNRYKQTTQTIVDEQLLKNKVSLLANYGYNAFKSNDYTQYDSTLGEVTAIESVLDTRLSGSSSEEVKLSYRSLKNSLKVVVGNIEDARHRLASGDITGISSTFTDANNKFDDVKQNVDDLLILETANISDTTVHIENIENILTPAIILAILISFIGSLLFSIFFARKITKPIMILSETAQSIINGDINMRVKKYLVERKDELGVLAKFFNLMLDTLKDEKSKVEETVKIRTKELGEEKARLLASINSLSFGFIIADMENHVILRNKAMTELFGFTDTDAVTIDNVSSLLGEHLNLKMQIERCFKDKTACEIKEIIFGTKFLKGIISPVIAEGGDGAIGYVFLLEDITEAKVIERSREEFFAVASHELRTPLTAIRGNMSTFKDFGDTLEEKEKKEIISDTYDASIRLIAIVNDFLDTSRLEQGKTTFKTEKVDLLPIIRDTCKDLDTLAKAKSLALSFTEPKDPIPLVLADHDRIKQAISNFIDNAIKYTEKGSVIVSIEKIDKFVAVSVTDTGKGISAQNQSLLFRKFQQAGEEMLARDVSKSTGLGLYITKLVVEAMGGTVGLAKSSLGEGSTFRLTMPIAE